MLSPVGNKAAERGPSVHAWWKDWRGGACAIVASGVSAKSAEIHLLQDKLPVIAIKKSLELCPFAEIVYGCDGPWWRSVNGLPDFKGLKLSYEREVCGPRWNIHKVDIELNSNRMETEKPGVLGRGGNSGFQGLNIAVQFGCKRVLLIGFDMHDRSGPHWYGRNNWPMANNPDDTHFRTWMAAFEKCKPDLDALGVEVFNASPISVMKTFPRIGIADALSLWKL